MSRMHDLSSPELGRRGQSTDGDTDELVGRLEEHRRRDAGVEGAQSCSWRGRVCELAVHLAVSCLDAPAGRPIVEILIVTAALLLHHLVCRGQYTGSLHGI